MKRLLLLLLMLGPCVATAATFNGILLTTSPENPGPLERVVVSASYLGSSFGTTYVWTVDGEIYSANSNQNSIAIDTPATGGSVEVAVAVLEGDQIVASKSLLLRPAEVTIEWVGDGARPPHFLGRPLLTGHGTVTATAISDLRSISGARISPSDTLFTWRVNGKIEKEFSGYGKNNLISKTSFYSNPFSISVTAEPRDGSTRAEDTVRIVPRSAGIVIYETSPLDGLQNNSAIQGVYNFSKSEASFYAYPLHSSRDAPANIRWTLGGSPVDVDTGDPRLAVFKKTGEGTGAFEVGVEYTNPLGFMDKSVQSFLLNF